MRFVFCFILCLNFTLIYSQTESANGYEQKIKSIFFGGGSFYFDEQQKEELSSFIAEVDILENYQIVISGHTDNIGGKEYNEWLSEMRTMIVKEHLMSMQIPEDQIHLKKFGQDNPLYNNKSHMGRLANRRVDVILIPIIF